MSLILDVHEPPRLYQLLARYGTPSVTIQDLESGDCVFQGYGPQGSILVGIERKTLSDLVDCMTTRRLTGVGGQIPRMWDTYDLCFLTVEGLWRPGPGGEIETYTGRRDKPWEPMWSRGGDGNGRHAISYRQVVSYLTMLKISGREHVVFDRTANMEETAALWTSLWHCFQKPWDEHTTYRQLWKKGPQTKGHGGNWANPHEHNEEFVAENQPGGRMMNVGVNGENPTTAWRWASDLPGVDRRAKVLAETFGTAYGLATGRPGARMSPEEELRAVAALRSVEFGETGDGRKRPGFGSKTAAAIVRAINEPGA